MTGCVSNFACLMPVVCQLWPSDWKILTTFAWPLCRCFTLYKHITLWISSQAQLPRIIFRNTSMVYCVAPTLDCIKLKVMTYEWPAVCLFVCLFLAQQPPVGQGLLVLEVSRSRMTYDAPQLVGHLSTGDQLVAETSTWQHTTLTTDKHPCPWWDSNPQSQKARSCRPMP